MAGRIHPPREPVSFTLDGERIVGERGESVAAALVGEGAWNLARSPKFHRPRGPSCLRGACDGCLARVDGVANVMTCLIPARQGLVVESQNTLGSRDLDLLRMTDWFFPDGMNHHELFAGVPGVQDAMQLFARRVAGLGLLPDPATVRPPSRAERRSLDVLVVGAGPAGMAAAVAAAGKGRAVEVVDDGLEPGGSARGLHDDDDPGLGSVRAAFGRAVASGAVKVRARTVAAAVFGRDVLVVELREADPAANAPTRGTVEVLEPRHLVIAAGAHDGVVAFENNDLAGVLSARAACLLAASGVTVGERVVLLADTTSPGLRFGDAFASRLARDPAYTCRLMRVTDVVAARGSSHVRSVLVRDGKQERSVSADALLVDAPRSPAYELCEQAGAKLKHRPAGFVPVTNRGRIAEGTWAIGEVTGAPLSAEAFMVAAEELASQLDGARTSP